MFAWAAAEAIKDKPALFMEIVNEKLKNGSKYQLELRKEVAIEQARSRNSRACPASSG